ncbi:MAG: serine protease [Acidimicrobiaceae bacterium]|nr:serine protease [Acidimicrobiaceae bacterium]
MSWVDLIIVVLVALAALRGFAEGAIRQILGLAGLVAGFLLGTALAPSLSTHVTHAVWRPVLALGIIVFVSAIGSVLGALLGSVVARFAHAFMLGPVDRVVGVVVGAVVALVLCWLVAGILASVTWGSVAAEIQGSSILSGMDNVMPPVPTIDAKVAALFPGAEFPAIFDKLVQPTLRQFVKPDHLLPLVNSLSEPTNIVKVLASGNCTGETESEGTAFYVASNDVLTNAHVLAGHTSFSVNGHAAEVALYDPENDLAVLRVPAESATPYSFVGGLPANNTKIQVIGFPLDGTRTRAVGYVEGELKGQGRDIYNQKVIAKTVIALEVNINPGNSGSPVLAHGRVVGIIDSKSLTFASTAYAIPDGIVQSDLAKVRATGTESTQNCLP